MYESFFGLTKRPFPPAPQTDFYFPSTSIESARQNMSRCIERSEGPGIILGAAGTGKSLLCRRLVDQFRDSMNICQLAISRICSRRTLLQAILFELNLPYRQLEEGELRLSLIDYLRRDEASSNGLILIIDEAHTLPTPLLDELRMVTNLVRDGMARVRLVLAGALTLEEKFASPSLESFSQRLAARCYLDSLNHEETLQFIRFQISTAGGEPGRIMTQEAAEEVHTTTQGVPRLINQLCDHALVMGALGERPQLDANGIQEAWADLQQLPAPVMDTVETNGEVTDGFIEFGDLDDRSEDRENDMSAGVTFADPPVMTTAEEQLEKIEDQVEMVSLVLAPQETQVNFKEEPFHPAGKIGPEIDAICHLSRDPFDERFEEEEVVMDRFANVDDTMPLKPPRVSSEEGRQLSSLMQQHPPRVSLDERVESSLLRSETVALRHSATSSQLPTVDEPSSVDAIELPPDGFVNEKLAASENTVLPQCIPDDPRVIMYGLRGELSSDEGVGNRSNRGLIVLPDDRDTSTVTDSDTGRSARHSGYGRLFVTLRRG